MWKNSLPPQQPPNNKIIKKEELSYPPNPRDKMVLACGLLPNVLALASTWM